MSLVLYDWVSITSKIDSPQSMVARLGIKDAVWESKSGGGHGYRDRLVWGHITLLYNGREDMGVWLEMSGQGCREFESFGNGDYDSLFEDIVDDPKSLHITRLDVAFDDHEGILDMRQICDDVDCNYPDPGCFISRLSEWDVRKSSKGATVVHGSDTSSVLIRIYDKARERGFTDQRWVRVEMQLRDDRAFNFIQNRESIGSKYFGVMKYYLRYVEDPGTDSNMRRWPTTTYWSNFLGTVEKISICDKPGVDYNLSNLEDFVYKQAGGAVATLIDIVGEDAFFKGIKKRGTKLNPKYKQLKEQCKMKKEVLQEGE